MPESVLISATGILFCNCNFVLVLILCPSGLDSLLDAMHGFLVILCICFRNICVKMVLVDVSTSSGL